MLSTQPNHIFTKQKEYRIVSLNDSPEVLFNWQALFETQTLCSIVDMFTLYADRHSLCIYLLLLLEL